RGRAGGVFLGGLRVSRPMRVASIVDGRPQFVKASRVSREVRLHNEEVLIHTGPRHEEGMGDAFLRVLEIPRPDYDLDIGPGTHARQTAEMLTKLEEVLEKEDPDIVLVYGDTNATLAGALA